MRRSREASADASRGNDWGCQLSELSTRFIQGADGVRLHIAEAGDTAKPLMVLLHGFPECGAAWHNLMVPLAIDHHVVAPDLRGYGLSDCPEAVSSYRIDRLVADVVELIKGMGASACTLVGHDWGGALAWAVALAHSDKVSKLVILNAPHPVVFARALAGDAAQQAASQYMNWLRRPGSEHALARDQFALLDAMLGSGSVVPWFRDSLKETYHRHWARPGVLRGMVNWYRATPLAPPQPGRTEVDFELPDAQHFTIRVPTLVIWGERDTALLPQLLDGLDALVPDLQICRIPTASHWLVHEATQQVLVEVRRFTAACPKPG